MRPFLIYNLEDTFNFIDCITCQNIFNQRQFPLIWPVRLVELWRRNVWIVDSDGKCGKHLREQCHYCTPLSFRPIQIANWSSVENSALHGKHSPIRVYFTRPHVLHIVPAPGHYIKSIWASRFAAGVPKTRTKNRRVCGIELGGASGRMFRSCGLKGIAAHEKYFNMSCCWFSWAIPPNFIGLCTVDHNLWNFENIIYRFCRLMLVVWWCKK